MIRSKTSKGWAGPHGSRWRFKTNARPSGRAGWSRPSGLHDGTLFLTGFSPRGTSAAKAGHLLAAQMQGWKPCSSQLAYSSNRHGFEPCLIIPKTDLSFRERGSHPLKTAKSGAASFVVIRSENFGKGRPAGPVLPLLAIAGAYLLVGCGARTLAFALVPVMVREQAHSQTECCPKVLKLRVVQLHGHLAVVSVP